MDHFSLVGCTLGRLQAVEAETKDFPAGATRTKVSLVADEAERPRRVSASRWKPPAPAPQAEGASAKSAVFSLVHTFFPFCIHSIAV